VPKRTDIESVLIIGAGPIVIGQACEFDYSGAQACKALREEGYKVILVNSNPATIMTDPEMADVTYIEPITWPMLATIIERERPDALLPTMGGQTALNCALDLAREGVLSKFDVELIGASKKAIDKAEDRKKFKDAMTRIGLGSAKSGMAHSLEEAQRAQADVGFPCIIRPSFTLGGTGGGIAYNRDEFDEICKRGLAMSPTHELLIEESLLGWKEFEMEVVRDRKDNCIIVCSIENLDPMGVHTGDSITVAPAQTLTDKEYQIMRDASIAVLREIGVDTGGSNVQFAISPKDGRMIVIEMNPRVSRSSALASKATGFPIAKIAAKLAVGYTLDELANDITGGRDARVVRAVDRLRRHQGPALRVREVQAGGRPADDADEVGRRGDGDRPHVPGIAAEGAARPRGRRRRLQPQDGRPDKIGDELAYPRAERLWYVADAFGIGMSLEELHGYTKIDPWFLAQIKEIVDLELAVEKRTLESLTRDEFRELKRKGFADRRLAYLFKRSEDEVRARRHALGPAAGLQARRHLRRRVRDPDRVHVLDLRGRVRGAADRSQEGHGARRRAQPHRAGDRVRLLLRARGDGAARGRVRDHHGQLQPGDGVDRLRHVRPPVLRAADARGRARDRARREAVGRDRAVRRPDAAQARARPRALRRADHRHLARHDRHGRGPRALPADAAPARAEAAAQPHGAHRGGRDQGGRGDRLPARRAARATCSAGARWRSCTSSASSSATCARR
jgi:carbamoyl-phosphate synthase large subunit